MDELTKKYEKLKEYLIAYKTGGEKHSFLETYGGDSNGI